MEKWVKVNTLPEMEEVKDDYYISNLGRVKGSRGILKVRNDKDGYLRLGLFYKDVSRGQRDARVHRLVAMAFVPGYDRKLVVDHIDNNKKNNNVSNLQWLTNKENVRKEGAIPVKATCLETGKEILYPSMKAAKEDGFFTSAIVPCCRNEYGLRKNIYKNHRWEYA